MGTKDEILIERLTRENEAFSKAKHAHEELAKQLDDYEKKLYLTPQDEVEMKILKKKKLAYKDKMEQILSQNR